MRGDNEQPEVLDREVIWKLQIATVNCGVFHMSGNSKKCIQDLLFSLRFTDNVNICITKSH